MSLNAENSNVENDSNYYGLVIVGSGPAGLSAAARAAELEAETGRDNTYLLLESFNEPAKTIYRYQKGKHVMEEPGFLDLRSPLDFESGTREEVLAIWRAGIEALGVRTAYNSEVVKIAGERDNFDIHCANGKHYRAGRIVLAIGVQGNPRRLGVAGDDSDFVQYQLDDPAEFVDKTIMVVGAGDAAIENALALSRQNRVYIVNRRSEFSRAKEGNLNGVLAAINNRNLDFDCFYESSVKSLTLPGGDATGEVLLKTAEGEVTVSCDLVIARLGAIPPRAFIEDCGIVFPSESPEAIPELSSEYESNVPGIYIVGALAGYPLIKQAMNQGYDVVEYINGRQVKPADFPLLELKLGLLPYAAGVDDILSLYQRRIPMFARMNSLAFRELVLESNILYACADQEETETLREQANERAQQRTADIRRMRAEKARRRQQAGRAPVADKPIPQPNVTRILRGGEFIYCDGEYSNTFFTIAEGEVTLRFGDSGVDQVLGPGQFFGEMNLLSGRPRLGDAIVSDNTVLIETPRRTMLKLINSNEEVAAGINDVFVQRSLQSYFGEQTELKKFRDVSRRLTTQRFDVGDTVYCEGDTGEHLYLVRSGTLSLSRTIGGKELSVGQVHSGQVFGQLALMGDPERRETARVVVRSELLAIGHSDFLELLRIAPQAVDRLKRDTVEQLELANRLESVPEGGETIRFLLDCGLGEATNALVIDENLCIGCDNCEKACAETHDGVNRLNRRGGQRFAHLNVPISCRHCEQPHCTKDCPTNAIRREPSGEVFIDETCIGCGNCETNCPYDVIHMSYKAPPKPGLFSWMFFGAGNGPGEEAGFEPTESEKERGKKAVKCDACVGQAGGPACVRACPTGAAARLSPSQFIEVISE